MPFALHCDPMKSLPPELLAHAIDPDALSIDDGIDSSRSMSLVGQSRAVRAIRFALNVNLPGYNLFVTGPTGIGKTRFVRHAIAERALQVDPCDWVYVNDFDSPDKPHAMALPAGQAVALKQSMRGLIDELRGALPAAFEADQHAQRISRIRQAIESHRRATLEQIRQEAEPHGLTVVQSADGPTIVPVLEGQALDAQAMAALPAAQREALSARIAELTDRLQAAQRDEIRHGREQLAQAHAVNRETAVAVVEPLVAQLRQRFASISPLLAWLDRMQQDMLTHLPGLFTRSEGTDESADDSERRLARYEVNVLVQACDGRAPVVQVDHPTVGELLGRIEYRASLGTLHTDFRLIKPGRLHEANGGYLLIDAWRLFSEPFAWDALKRALQRRAIRIETVAETASGTPAAQLDPEPIPLNVKVILFAERYSTDLLREHDPDFDALFRVVADFDDTLERTGAHLNGMAQVLLEQACGHGLLPLKRPALAALLDEAVRRSDDTNRISAHVQLLTEVAVEAGFEAQQAGDTAIAADHVRLALASRRERAGRLQAEHQRDILLGTVLIDTQGEQVGQVNALAVFDVGNEMFGQPSRITATTRLGEGMVLDVQRETHLGGPIHSKGVMILKLLSRGPVCAASTFADQRDAGVRAELWADRWRQRNRGRILRVALGPGRGTDPPGSGGHRLDEPVGRSPGRGRHQSEDRGIFRHLSGPRPERHPGRDHSGEQRGQSDAGRAARSGGSPGALPRLCGDHGRRGDRTAHGHAGGQLDGQLRLAHDQRPGQSAPDRPAVPARRQSGRIAPGQVFQ